MKKFIYISLCMLPLAAFSQTKVTDTVNTGANYTNQIWYSLESDEVKSESKDNWDLAFELNGFYSSVLVNTQKTGLHVYQTPYTWDNWASFDSTGYSAWTELHNSDTSWEIGALNKLGEHGTGDMGWGEYDMNTHAVLGTNIYLLVHPNGDYYQLGVNSLISGIYTCTYKSLDNSDSNTFTIKKSDYSQKNFAYFSIESGMSLDREPSNEEWDFTFTKYIFNDYPFQGGFIPYPVTGLLQNKGVQVAELQQVDVEAENDYMSAAYSNQINTIGSDWKTFAGQFVITDSLLFFVKDVHDEYWKVIMTGFGGAANGQYIFSKEKISETSIFEINKTNRAIVYPNPAVAGSKINIITDFKDYTGDIQISISDVSGRVMYSMTHSGSAGFEALELPFTLSEGVYFVQVQAGNSISYSQVICR